MSALHEREQNGSSPPQYCHWRLRLCEAFASNRAFQPRTRQTGSPHPFPCASAFLSSNAQPDEEDAKSRWDGVNRVGETQECGRIGRTCE